MVLHTQPAISTSSDSAFFTHSWFWNYNKTQSSISSITCHHGMFPSHKTLFMIFMQHNSPVYNIHNDLGRRNADLALYLLHHNHHTQHTWLWSLYCTWISAVCLSTLVEQIPITYVFKLSWQVLIRWKTSEFWHFIGLWIDTSFLESILPTSSELWNYTQVYDELSPGRKCFDFVCKVRVIWPITTAEKLEGLGVWNGTSEKLWIMKNSTRPEKVPSLPYILSYTILHAY